MLGRDARGWLVPGAEYFRLYMDRPELALLPESCRAERALHEALCSNPLHEVKAGTLQVLRDPDARESYGLFLRFRDALVAAGTLEGYYLALMRSGRVDVPPLFVDLLVEAIVRNVLDDSADAYEARAGEFFFRPQRISIDAGQVLAGDQAVLDMLNETGGLGDIGRLLAEAKAPMRELKVEVLAESNAQAYWQGSERHSLLLDLTHEVKNELGHGLVFTLTRARSGLTALARVMEKWVAHFLSVGVHIAPLQKIEDESWRWHVGLDAQASALLNDLYEGAEVEPGRLKRLLSLFRLDFDNSQEMRTDVRGKPVYLGLMMAEGGAVRMKPQNLLLNLPLANAS